MNPTLVTESSRDRSYRAAEVMVNGKTFKTPNVSMLLKATRPNELELYYHTKARYSAEYARTYVMRMHDVPNLLTPELRAIFETRKNFDLEGKQARHPFEKFLGSHVGFPDCGLEYLYFENHGIQNRIRKFAEREPSLAPIVEYIKMYQLARGRVADRKKFDAIKGDMHRNTWLDEIGSRQETKLREGIVGGFMKYESLWFDHDVNPCPLIDSKEMLELALELNLSGQNHSYANGREKSLYLLLHPSVLYDVEIVEAIVKALVQTKAKLIVLKFKRLDLRTNVDYIQRENFKRILEAIASIKAKDKTKAFALWEAGNQFFIALPAFEMVSRSFGIIEGDVGFGRYSKRGSWWDGIKMWPRKEREATTWFKQNLTISQNHCVICEGFTDLALLSDDTYRRARRQCFMFDMNSKARLVRESIESNKSDITLNRILLYSELAPLHDLILNRGRWPS
jgi:hypothetical protein